MSADTITDLLNKVSAIVKSGAATFKELSDETGIPIKQLYDLVNLRRNRPNGERAVLLHQWAANRTLHISRRPHLAEKYRNAFEAACMKFPVNGKE